MSATHDLTASIIDALWKKGGRGYRRNVGGMRTRYVGKDGREREHFVKFGGVGQFDVWGITREGIHVEFEVKSRTDKPSKAQWDWEAEIGNHAVACFVRSIDEVLYVLDGACRDEMQARATELNMRERTAEGKRAERREKRAKKKQTVSA